MKTLYFIDFYLLLSIVNCYSQNTEDKDSIRFGEQDYSCHMVDTSIEIKNYSSLIINKIPFDMHNAFMQSASPNIQLTNKIISPFFTPYSYSFDNYMEGMIIKGFYASCSFTDYLAANMNVYLSKTYFWNTAVPDFYLNGSVRAELILKLHDQVQLTGMGQLSLREGPDPKIPSLTGGANYYGAGIQFKITNKVGIGVGFTNNYYRGKWTKRTHMVPVGY